jgi:hypothetical protein
LVLDAIPDAFPREIFSSLKAEGARKIYSEHFRSIFGSKSAQELL